MGCPRYSTRISSASTTRTSTPAVSPEPQPEPAVAVFEKWSPLNPFDPDSEEFWANAIHDEFVDNQPMRENSQPFVDPVVGENQDIVARARRLSWSSASESESEGSSPMAVGADDPAALITQVYTPDWDRQLASPALDTDSEVAPTAPWIHFDRFDAEGESARLQRRHVARPPVLASASYAAEPPSSLRNSTTVADLGATGVHRPVAVYLREANERIAQDVVHVDERDGAVPFIPVMPSTPPTPAASSPSQPSFSPSPSVSVTPRFYTWAGSPRAASESAVAPVPIVAPRVGPLSNPGARMSYAHITPRISA
ncbi:hypothetical protein FISHEDRAFT_72167 [Fistulina hepatica ATCC 64428]|uniref:Uncharacterized protein n=1 Tax=Fistulina hepatica ATCC 64428 TaxID=1128425 RepID=A0A0D7AEZ0_9AGAR|nr:hypothetical protein FISHEDRAFT_72167 [Fistulina hepatica ATCC 64428]